jgi:hypothetical protein
MAIRNEKASTAKILQDARFHRAAVGGHPKTLRLVERINAPYLSLKAARNATEEAEDAAMDAFARLTLADFELDEECRQSELDVLGATGKDRDAVEYRACFGLVSLGELVAMRGVEQADAVKTLVEALARQVPAVHAERGERLLALAATATTAEAAWLEAERLAGGAFANEKIERLQVVRQLQKNQGALTEIFPGNRRRVRSFYRPGKARVVEAEPTDTDADDDET